MICLQIELIKYQADELEHWTDLEHPNLVQLLGALRVNNKIYIFSEFYAAGELLPCVGFGSFWIQLNSGFRLAVPVLYILLFQLTDQQLTKNSIKHNLKNLTIVVNSFIA